MSEEQSEEVSSQRNQSRGRAPLYIAIAAAIIGLLLVCVFAFFIFCPEGECISSFNGEPTPTIIPQQVESFNLATPAIMVAIDGSNAVSLTIDIPSVLSVGGQDFPVQPSAPDIGGQWKPIIANNTTSVWLNNTVINYVFAIRDTPANRTLVDSLERGDEMIITAQSGEQRVFNFNSRNPVPSSQDDVFAQNSPNITLLLIGSENSDRIVIKGNYQVEQAAQNIGVGGDAESNIAALGEVIQLGDLQIAASTFDNRPQDGSGLAYYLVDYQVQNIGTGPIDTSQIKMVLVDSVGNEYVVSADASQLGNYRSLPPQLSVGESIQATAGYQIPSGLDSNSLGWVVQRVDTGEMVEIRVTDSEEEADDLALRIVADPPQLSPDAGQLFMTGLIENTGTSAAIIDASDVSFESEGADFFILSTKPPFPWVIQPGAMLEYELAVQRPVNSDVSIFTILNQSFQVTNYR